MRLVQFLLPVRDNSGARVASTEFNVVRRELTERFGGVTAYLRAPAAGVWKDSEGDVSLDEVIMVEVVVENFDRVWWGEYRRTLEGRFAQASIHMRSIGIEVL